MRNWCDSRPEDSDQHVHAARQFAHLITQFSHLIDQFQPF
ncbi:hypothetical protein STXM2123_4000 [Streptomyces sp. F-3]|nr:hypothetical protein STXM2123_4000 [Streptomyces sp. F-3]